MRVSRLAPAPAVLGLLVLAGCSSTTSQDDIQDEVGDAGPDATVSISTNGQDAGSDATTTATIPDGASPPPVTDAALPDAATVDAGPAMRHPYALTGLLSTGQSLSVGVDAYAVVDTTQPYHNVRLEDSVADPSYTGSPSMVPMVSPLRTLNSGGSFEYPTNIYGETPSEPAANEVSALSLALDPAGGDYPSTTSNVGESGQALTVIQKNGTGNAYAQSIREATVLTKLAQAANQSFGYGAIFLTHGESDYPNTMYEAGIVQLQADYDADLRAITGQVDAGPIPIILSQQATFPGDATTSPVSTLQAWQASVDHPTAIICAGPKYQYEYASDFVHMLAPGYIRLGQKYAEAYVQQVGLGVPWHPLQPLSVARVMGSTTELVVHLDVAHPPLAWDPSLMVNHTSAHTAWTSGNGFEVSDSTGELAIKSATIEGTDVHLILATAPTGTGLTVAYAMTQDAAAYAGGLPTGRHGALCDSDPFVGRDAETIAVTATTGSAVLTAVTTGAFAARANHDVVTGGGLPGGVAIASRSGDTVTLSSNWTGASGTQMLHFAHDERNYLVQFSLPVP